MIIGVVTNTLYVACTGTNTDPTAIGVTYDYNKAVRELWELVHVDVDMYRYLHVASTAVGPGEIGK